MLHMEGRVWVCGEEGGLVGNSHEALELYSAANNSMRVTVSSRFISDVHAARVINKRG